MDDPSGPSPRHNPAAMMDSRQNRPPMGPPSGAESHRSAFERGQPPQSDIEARNHFDLESNPKDRSYVPSSMRENRQPYSIEGRSRVPERDNLSTVSSRDLPTTTSEIRRDLRPVNPGMSNDNLSQNGSLNRVSYLNRMVTPDNSIPQGYKVVHNENNPSPSRSPSYSQDRSPTHRPTSQNTLDSFRKPGYDPSLHSKVTQREGDNERDVSTIPIQSGGNSPSFRRPSNEYQTLDMKTTPGFAPIPAPAPAPSYPSRTHSPESRMINTQPHNRQPGTTANNRLIRNPYPTSNRIESTSRSGSLERALSHHHHNHQPSISTNYKQEGSVFTNQPMSTSHNRVEGTIVTNRAFVMPHQVSSRQSGIGMAYQPSNGDGNITNTTVSPANWVNLSLLLLLLLLIIL